MSNTKYIHHNMLECSNVGIMPNHTAFKVMIHNATFNQMRHNQSKLSRIIQKFRNVLPIFNGKVPKKHSLSKIAQQHCSKSCPVYHHL